MLPVNHQPQAEVTEPLGGGGATVRLVSDREGWVCMRLDDPAQARYPIERVLRGDGKQLHPRNVWTNIRYRESDNFRFSLPLAHEVCEGNLSDTETLVHILQRLRPGSGGDGASAPLVILDAGFASKANLALLKELGLDQAGELCGNHVLRTDQALGAARIWSLYMTLLQAEEAFACLEGALGLRPNFHQPEDRVEVHPTSPRLRRAGIFISVLAYHLLCWVRERLRDSGDLRDWKTLRRLLSTHSLATTRLPLEDGRVLHIRKATVPDAEQAQVYRKLGVDWKSEFPMRKSFVKS